MRESANNPDIIIALVGNKSDLVDEAQVNTQETFEWAKEIKAEVVRETSAKDDVGVQDLF